MMIWHVVVFPYGSDIETEEMHGVIHLCEHLFLNTINNPDIYISGYTDFDRMVLIYKYKENSNNENIVIKHIDMVESIDDDIFNETNLGQAIDEIVKEYNVLKEKIIYKTNLYNIIDKNSHLPIGTYDVFSKIRLDDLKEFVKCNVKGQLNFLIKSNGEIKVLNTMKRRSAIVCKDYSQMKILKKIHYLDKFRNKLIIYMKCNFENTDIKNKAVRIVFSYILMEEIISLLEINKSDIHIVEKIILNNYFIIFEICNIGLYDVLLINKINKIFYEFDIILKNNIDKVLLIIKNDLSELIFEKNNLVSEFINWLLYNEFPLVNERNIKNFIYVIECIDCESIMQFYNMDIDKTIHIIVDKTYRIKRGIL